MSGNKKAANSKRGSRSACNGGSRKKTAARREERKAAVPVRTKAGKAAGSPARWRSSALDGDTAAALGINISTFHQWRHTHEFGEALEMATRFSMQPSSALSRSERSVTATPKKKVFRTRDGTIDRVQTVKHALPDVKAAIASLRNGSPDWDNEKKDPKDVLNARPSGAA